MKEPKRRILFFVAMSLYYFSACLVHPVTPALIVERGLDSAMFGVALAAMNLMNFLFSPLWGTLCGRISTKKILLICCFGYALGQGAFACARTEEMVMAGRMFAGLFVGGIFTSAGAYVVNTSADPQARGGNLMVMVTLQSVLNAVGYFAGGLLGVAGVEVAFLVQILSLAATGLLFYSCCVDDGPTEKQPPLTLRQLNPFAAFLGMRELVTPLLGLLLAVVALGGIGQDAFEQCFNFSVRDRFGLSSAYNGAFKAAIAVVSLLANATLGLWLRKHTDTNRSFLLVMLGCTLPLCAILLFDSIWPFVAMDILFFGFNAMRLPIQQNLAAIQAKPGTNVMGLYNAMRSLGGILGAMFAGLLYDRGQNLPFVLAAGAFLLGTVLSGVYARRYGKKASLA